MDTLELKKQVENYTAWLRRLMRKDEQHVAQHTERTNIDLIHEVTQNHVKWQPGKTYIQIQDEVKAWMKKEKRRQLESEAKEEKRQLEYMANDLANDLGRLMKKPRVGESFRQNKILLHPANPYIVTLPDNKN